MDKLLQIRLQKISTLISNAINTDEELNEYACQLREEGINFGIMIQAAVNFEETPALPEEIKDRDRQFLSALRIAVD